MSKVVAAFAQLGDLQERSDRQQALATKAVEVDKSHSCMVAWFITVGVHDIGTWLSLHLSWNPGNGL